MPSPKRVSKLTVHLTRDKTDYLAANYKGNSGMPWWALTVLLIISFFFCVLYGLMAATIGFTQFTTSGTSFFQMITGKWEHMRTVDI